MFYIYQDVFNIEKNTNVEKFVYNQAAILYFHSISFPKYFNIHTNICSPAYYILLLYRC